MNQNQSVVVCDTQPLAIEGMRTLIENTPDLRFSGAVGTLLGGMEYVRSLHPTVVVIDKAFGTQAVLDWLSIMRNSRTGAIVWGSSIGNAEALRYIQAGARGVLQKTSDIESIRSCVRTVATGATWMADGLLSCPDESSRPVRSHLTPRESQVVELVEKGLRNKDIAQNLGIQTGTVKIHLKHIFEKTGCRGRYGLALSGLREKGQIPQLTM